MAPSLTLTIDGVDKSEFIGRGMALELLLLEKSTLRFDTGNSSFVSRRYADVYLTRVDPPNPDEILFGGLLKKREIKALFEDNDVALSLVAECKDFFTFLDWANTKIEYTDDQTLKVWLTAAIAALIANDPTTGITVDPAQANGPTIPAQAKEGTVADILRALSQDSGGWIAQIDPVTKYIRMALPGYLSAPTTVVEGDADLGSFEVSDPDSDQPNAIYMLIGEAGDIVTQEWTWHTGDSLAFVTDFPSLPDGYAYNFAVTINDGSVVNPSTGRFDTLSPPGLGGYFDWDESTHTLTKVGGPVLNDGDTVAFSYRPQFPYGQQFTTGGGPPTISRREVRPEIKSLPAAQALANGLFASFAADARKATYTRKDFGWKAGQVASCLVPSRTISTPTDFSIDSVLYEWTTENDFVASIQATEGNIYKGNSLTRWRELLGGGSGGSVSVTGGDVAATSITNGPWHLGGAREGSIPMDSPPVRVTTTFFGTFVPTATRPYTITAQIRARTAGVSVKLQLVRVSDDTVVGDSGFVTSTAWTDVAFVVPCSVGEKYRPYAVSDTDYEDPYVADIKAA